ncbi:MAG: peptidyl-prolyl cis-trans isomerase, partial [Gammaproteobacteria bacterium]|nr:peptidyl-prolyl cis-trans isomerase [Gammaproteobacteria bacterium]
LRQFNLSLLITDEFMRAVKNDDEWKLAFPVTVKEVEQDGLDVNDDEVKRRLVEKIQYLNENLADPEPTEAELRAYFEQQPERFEIPPLATFDQVFFSPRMRGDAVVADAEAALAALKDGASPEDFGDSTPLESRFVLADPDRIRVLLRDAITDAVFGAETGTWLGPYESDFGLHLIRVVERSAARQPSFEEVAGDVREAYIVETLERANEAAYAEIRSRYDIAVEWQDGAAAEPWP